jgi:hypothetical protein
MSLIELETTDLRADEPEVSAPIPDEGVEGGTAAGTLGAPIELEPDTRIEVRSRFDRRWAAGFEVIDADELGYRVRRLSDGAELPIRFSRDEIRRERRRGQWWY